MVNLEVLEKLVNELKKNLPENKEGKMSSDDILKLSKSVGLLVGISGEAMGLIQDIYNLGKTRMDLQQVSNVKFNKDAN